jgi:hypothetical protein
VGCPIRISADQSLFAAPHGFSQRTTSFIACACQGIHRTPLRHLIALIFNARPSRANAPGWKRLSRDETNGILRPIAEQTMGRNPFPHEPRTETGLRKTSVTRELPVGGAGHAPSAFAHPSPGRPDNSSLHDVNAGPKAGGKSENRSQMPESLPTSAL